MALNFDNNQQPLDNNGGVNNNQNPMNAALGGNAAKGCFGLSKAAILGIVVLLALGGWACSTRNGFVNQEKEVEAGWSEVENTYQRRADLYKTIAANVKKYDKHERETYQGVTNARAGKLQESDQQMQAVTTMADSLNAVKADPNDLNAMKEYINAQNKLKDQLSLAINVVHEAYPDLKAEDLHKDFQVQMEGTENRITNARREYIKKAKEYNRDIELFPGMIVAKLFNFAPKPFFEADEGSKKVPDVAEMLED